MYYPSVITAIFGIVIWMIALLVHLLALYRAIFYLYSWRKSATSHSTKDSGNVGVSVIKTITNGSPNVLMNLESVLNLNYPKFEVLVCVQDEDSDVIKHIEELLKKYPSVDAHIYKGAMNIGVNPKINNIMQCYDFIKYNYFWICDSNIYVQDWLLHELVSHINPNVGMLHQLPFMHVSESSNFSQSLEKVYFGTNHARWYLALDALGLCCTNGMSSIINKKLIDEVGGLAGFSHYLAEDAFIGMSLYNRNHHIVLSTEPALQNPDVSLVRNFIQRTVRWQKLRLSLSATCYLEPFMECLLTGVIGSSSLAFLYNTNFIFVLVIHILYWFICDQLLMWRIQQKHSSLQSFGMQCFAWLFREVITYIIYVQAVWNRKITWRMGTFVLKFGGKTEFIQAETVKQA